ncbi:MAG: hypothetical protein WD750_04565 [Gammaproteobacteria bacterium]
MAERYSIPLLLLLSALMLPVAEVRAQEVIIQENIGESAGGGAVIEIGGGKDNGGDAAGPGTTPTQGEPVNITRNPGNTGIEMIIGGQSEDGVAKRGNLPVVE